MTSATRDTHHPSKLPYYASHVKICFSQVKNPKGSISKEDINTRVSVHIEWYSPHRNTQPTTLPRDGKTASSPAPSTILQPPCQDVGAFCVGLVHDAFCGRWVLARAGRTDGVTNQRGIRGCERFTGAYRGGTDRPSPPPTEHDQWLGPQRPAIPPLPLRRCECSTPTGTEKGPSGPSRPYAEPVPGLSPRGHRQGHVFRSRCKHKVVADGGTARTHPCRLPLSSARIGHGLGSEEYPPAYFYSLRAARCGSLACFSHRIPVGG